MVKTLLIVLGVLSFLSNWGQGPYSPAVGNPSTNAIHKDSSIIVAWAEYCTVNRGPQDIAVLNSPLVNAGIDSDAILMADGSTVSLGDGGYATIEIPTKLYNGSGYDFAIFENSFSNDFLELAFVEVSSDGINFVRFPNYSLTQDTISIGSFGSIEASNVHNLAGKYRAQYGTPFDLQDLADSSQIDIMNINHIRIIDVIGTIDESLATFDSDGRKINDPYPTDYPTGGFDLDAVGFININSVGMEEEHKLFTVYPNPSSDIIYIYSSMSEFADFEFFNIQGVRISNINIQDNIIKISHLPKGIYFLKIANQVEKIIIQ